MTLFVSYGLIRQFCVPKVASKGEFKALPAVYLVSRYLAGALGGAQAVELSKETLPGVVEPPGGISNASRAGAVALAGLVAAGRH